MGTFRDLRDLSFSPHFNFLGGETAIGYGVLNLGGDKTKKKLRGTWWFLVFRKGPQKGVFWTFRAQKFWGSPLKGGRYIFGWGTFVWHFHILGGTWGSLSKKGLGVIIWGEANFLVVGPPSLSSFFRALLWATFHRGGAT